MHDQPPFPTMPFMLPFEPLLRLFQGAPRRGPGSEASTLKALAACRCPPQPSVADLGCGSGASTLILARHLRVPILAVDADGRALDDLWEAARTEGLLPWIRPCPGDMAAPGLPPGSLDLLWSEGAVAHLGWERGLRLWGDLLRPGGVMAFTDATWFEEDPPEEARRNWEVWYPTMATEASNLAAARALGLEVVDHFRLPRQDWWDYFQQVERQCEGHQNEEGLVEVIAAMREETDLYRRTGHSYGYTFYILRRPA